MRIVRLANVAATSGGLGTALRELGAGYRAAGHEPVLIVPGTVAGSGETEQGRVVTLPGPVVPGLGGYRVLSDRARVAALLGGLRPDRIEVHDRTTLRWIGAWAARLGVPSLTVSHESLDGPLRRSGAGRAVSRLVADRLNARTAATFDTVVCTTTRAAAEFRRVGARNVVHASLGVDLELFNPERHDRSLRSRYARADEILLVQCGRLSTTKRPRRALAALAVLRAAGAPAVLVVADSGRMEPALRAEALRRRLPVHFTGHLTDHADLAALLATADVVLACGPIETSGAALEALAGGTPVVVDADTALPDVIGDAGVATRGGSHDYAAAIGHLLTRPQGARRAAARAQAERYPWTTAVAQFLNVHHTAVSRQRPARG